MRERKGSLVNQKVRLLCRMFSKVEWEYLMNQGQFSKQLASAMDTLDDVEKLSVLGERMLQEVVDREIEVEQQKSNPNSN